MKKLLVTSALIGMVLLMGCLESRTFTKVNTGSKLLGFESIGSQNVTVENYKVNDVDAWYYVLSLSLDDIRFNQVIAEYGELMEMGQIENRDVYFTYESIEKLKVYSIIWFADSSMYQIGTDTETIDFEVMSDLFKVYNNI